MKARLNLDALARGLNDSVVDAHYPDGITPAVALRWTDEIFAEFANRDPGLHDDRIFRFSQRLSKLERALPDFRRPKLYTVPEVEHDLRTMKARVAVRHEDGSVRVQ